MPHNSIVMVMIPMEYHKPSLPLCLLDRPLPLSCQWIHCTGEESTTARYNRNNSDVVSGTGADQPSPTHQWPPSTTNTSDPRNALVAHPPKLPARPKSRFQDDPQSQLDGRKDLVLSPPRVLVETAHRRSISSSTCSLEKLGGLGGNKGLLSSRGWRSVSRELESVGRHLDMVVDDDVMQINSFLKRQRALIARIDGKKGFHWLRVAAGEHGEWGRWRRDDCSSLLENSQLSPLSYNNPFFL